MLKGNYRRRKTIVLIIGAVLMVIVLRTIVLNVIVSLYGLEETTIGKMIYIEFENGDPDYLEMLLVSEKLPTPISNGGLILAPPGHSTGSALGAGFTDTISACCLLMGGSLCFLSFYFVHLFLILYILPYRFLIHISY